MSEHLSEEAFTRLIDGDDDPAAQSHLDQCSDCSIKLQQVQSAIQAVRSELQIDSSRRDQAINKSLEAFDNRSVGQPKQKHQILQVAAAVVFLALLVGVGVRSLNGKSSSRLNQAGSSLSNADSPTGGSSSVTSNNFADFGEISSLEELRGKVEGGSVSQEAKPENDLPSCNAQVQAAGGEFPQLLATGQWKNQAALFYFGTVDGKTHYFVTANPSCKILARGPR